MKKTILIMTLLVFAVVILSIAKDLSAQEAPGRPGNTPRWASAQKIGVGTSYEAYDLDGNYSNLSQTAPISKVWFTIANGILTETYFPTIDTAQTAQTQLLITDGKTFVEEEKNGIHSIEWIDTKAPIFRIITQDKLNRYTITKTFFSHPEKNVVFIQYTIKTSQPNLKFYLTHHPRAMNSGYKNSGILESNVWIAHRDNHYQALITNPAIQNSTVGFVGTSDGETDLKNHFSLTSFYTSATNGHIGFVGQAPLSFTLSLGFGFSKEEALQKAQSSLTENLDQIRSQYISEWHSYFKNILDLSSFSGDQGKEFYASTVLLKAHEDKTYPGAIVASLSIPWGDQNDESIVNEYKPYIKLNHFSIASQDRGTGGYHLVWPRDLFQIARSFMSIHDYASAKNCLRFLKSIQFTSQDGVWSFDQRSAQRTGSFPQSTWVDGSSFWQGLQMDQTAFPIILAWHLWQAGEINIDEYWPMIESAANFIAGFGPWTAQERWEENYGISPSTVAAEITALICASDLASAKGSKDLHVANRLIEQAKYWADTADHWSLTPNDNIESWTFTTSGLWGNGKYYLRLDGASRFSQTLQPDYLATWNPNDNKSITLANASGTYLEKEVVDGGFLELVRYGVRSATHPFILDSLSEYDDKIKIDTPFGPAWYRYLYDGYGEEGRGRLWTFLTGERAQYELALLSLRKSNPKVITNTLNQYIKTLEGFGNEGHLFSEQIWDTQANLGKQTGSACPLMWSHAEYIKLLRSKADQKPFDLIPIVYSRYKDY